MVRVENDRIRLAKYDFKNTVFHTRTESDGIVIIFDTYPPPLFMQFKKPQIRPG